MTKIGYQGFRQPATTVGSVFGASSSTQMLGPFDDLHNRPSQANVSTVSPRAPIVAPVSMSGSMGNYHAGYGNRYAEPRTPGLAPPVVT